jgi:hypothetical protein
VTRKTNSSIVFAVPFPSQFDLLERTGVCKERRLGIQLRRGGSKEVRKTKVVKMRGIQPDVLFNHLSVSKSLVSTHMFRIGCQLKNQSRYTNTPAPTFHCVCTICLEPVHAGKRLVLCIPLLIRLRSRWKKKKRRPVPSGFVRSLTRAVLIS